MKKFFFFKQKTAYEMLRSLVGSEMCIRDRVNSVILVVSVGRLSKISSDTRRRMLCNASSRALPVSYTHLTLPTSHAV